MKGNWNNLQKTLPDNNQIGKLVELKIANTKTSGYINVNTNETCDVLFHIATGKYGELFAEITLKKKIIVLYNGELFFNFLSIK